MSFIWPTMLLSLLLVPLFVVVYLRLQWQRRQLVARYGTLGIMQEAARRPLGARRHIPVAFFLTGLTILLISLARPETVVTLPRLEGTVILAFDVSGSMAADDLQPTRMEAAKSAARLFVERQPANVQIGVIAFSDSGFAVQPPTHEREPVLAAIERLTPERSTSLAQGIHAALNTLFVEHAAEPAARLYSTLPPSPTPAPTPVPEGVYAPAVIVLLTDGENTAPPDPFDAAQSAVARGVRIHTVGIGSPAGTILQLEGFSVHTQLDEAALRQIAHVTGGSYFNALDEDELLSIYAGLDSELVLRGEKLEVTSLFAGASILILLMGGAFSLVWFSRVP
jgi:Ca-activated chloride channel homolog